MQITPLLKLSGLLLFLIFYCPLSAEESLAEDSLRQKQAVLSSNDLAFKIYAEIAKAGENVFFSPLSIIQALKLAQVGARGETAGEFTKLLAAASVSTNQSTDSDPLSSILSALKPQTENSEFEFRLSNSLWLDSSYELLSEYLSQLEKNFGTGINRVDFRSQAEAARQKINSWVEKQTNDKIKDLIPSSSIRQDTTLVLVNAVYFYGAWLMPFNKAQTKEDLFFNSKTISQKASFMRLNEQDFLYAENEQAQLIELPYKDTSLVMNILLPKEGRTLNELNLKNLYPQLKSQLQFTPVNILLPRFKLELPLSLTEVLKQLGLSTAFNSETADFSGMSGNRELFFSEVLHKAFLEVKEEGSEAAAATAILVARTSAPIAKPAAKEFKARHPFAIFIQDSNSEVILFMGKLERVEKLD